MIHRENCFKEIEIIRKQNSFAFKEVNTEEEYLNTISYQDIIEKRGLKNWKEDSYGKKFSRSSISICRW